MLMPSTIFRRTPPIFMLVALCTPAALALVLAQGFQSALATIGVTLAALLGALLLYRYRPTRVVLHVLLVVVPIVIFYRALYRGPISPGVFLSIISTTPSEATELLGKHLWITGLLVIFLAIAIYCVFACWWVPDPFRRKVHMRAFVLSSVTLGLWAAVTFYKHGELHNLNWALKDSAREVFPLDVILSTKIVANGKLETLRSTAARAGFRFKNVHLANLHEASEPEIFVVVLGESSRRKSWSLYGYTRATTPLLEAMRPQLVVFDNATANANITMYSIGLLLTRASPTSWDVARRERSLITLLRQGGYSVSWISNQERFGFSENPVSAISLEAGSTSFANDYVSDPKSDVQRDPYDSNLLPRLSAELARFVSKPGKAMIFLHTMGSHDAYDERYPVTFDVFHGTRGGDDPLDAQQRRIVDQYDNSIRFTDYVLSSIIQQVAALNRSSAVFYFSDHGERLFEPSEPELRGHGFPTPSIAELEIPFLVWLSPAYRSAHPEFVTRLEARVHTPAQLENVFETIVDLAGLTYDGRATDSSLFSANFKAPNALRVLTTSQVPMCAPLPKPSETLAGLESSSSIAFSSCAPPYGSSGAAPGL